MRRLSRQPGFDIRDEPEDCYDATGQFPQLATDRDTDVEFEPETQIIDELPPRASRRRAAVAVALALAGGGITALLARDPSTQPPASTLAESAPAAPEPKPADSAPIRRTKPPATTPLRKPKAKRSPARPSGRPVTIETEVAARVRPSAPRRPSAVVEPAGGEFVLGAR